MDHKIRVLVIAPYEEMREQVLRTAQFYSEIELTVFVGDLEEGAAIAQKNFHANYDAILSRGGTARLIQQLVPLPVVEIGISFYDILCAYKLTSPGMGLSNESQSRIAVVGFSGITKNAHLLCEVLNLKLDVFTLESAEMVRPILQQAQRAGCSVVLCDMIANKTAKQMGLNTLLINSGTESIRSSFDQLIRLVHSYDTLREENQFLRQILMNQGTNTVVLNEEGSLFFSTLPDGEEGKEILEMLRPEIEQVVGEDRCKLLRNKKGTLYTIYGQRFHTSRQTFIAFFFTQRKAPLLANRCGITFFSRNEVQKIFYDSLFSMSDSARELTDSFSGIELETTPLMLAAENGAGVDQAAHAIYLNSSMANKPLVNINCALLNEKTWDFLMNSANSPLCDTGNTLFFQNIDTLGADPAQELIAAIQVMEVRKRNRILFSCLRTAMDSISSTGHTFSRQFGCLIVPLPALRERADSIPALVGLYLNHLNPTLDRQVAGIAPEGLRYLQSYSWPYNYTQFKRLLHEMAVLSTGPIISTAEVRHVLKKEESAAAIAPREQSSDEPLDLTRPLCEIDREIVRRVLSETGNNQSAAAKRLGISRTTLWRMMQMPN